MRRFSVSKQFTESSASVIEYEIQFFAYKKRIRQPSDRTKRKGIVNKVTDLRLSPGLCEEMLVVSEFVGPESLLVNETAQWSNLGYFCCPGAFEKGKGGYRIGDYHAGIYFFSSASGVMRRFSSGGVILGRLLGLEKKSQAVSRETGKNSVLSSVYIFIFLQSAQAVAREAR